MRPVELTAPVLSCHALGLLVARHADCCAARVKAWHERSSCLSKRLGPAPSSENRNAWSGQRVVARQREVRKSDTNIHTQGC